LSPKVAGKPKAVGAQTEMVIPFPEIRVREIDEESMNGAFAGMISHVPLTGAARRETPRERWHV
jgi:hypothetical protein